MSLRIQRHHGCHDIIERLRQREPGRIDTVGLKLEGHKDARTMVVVARATDGYVVTFSYNELYNTAIGKDVLVAWEKDGQPLGPHEGQFLLISGQDIKTGPRHVRNLADIRIVRMK